MLAPFRQSVAGEEVDLEPISECRDQPVGITFADTGCASACLLLHLRRVRFASIGWDGIIPFVLIEDSLKSRKELIAERVRLAEVPTCVVGQETSDVSDVVFDGGMSDLPTEYRIAECKVYGEHLECEFHLPFPILAHRQIDSSFVVGDVIEDIPSHVMAELQVVDVMGAKYPKLLGIFGGSTVNLLTSAEKRACFSMGLGWKMS